MQTSNYSLEAKIARAREERKLKVKYLLLFFQKCPVLMWLILYQQRIEKENALQLKKKRKKTKVDVNDDTERVTGDGGLGEGGSSVAEQEVGSSREVEEEDKKEGEEEEEVEEEEGEEVEEDQREKSVKVSQDRQHPLLLCQCTVLAPSCWLCAMLCCSWSRPVLPKKDILLVHQLLLSSVCLGYSKP